MYMLYWTFHSHQSQAIKDWMLLLTVVIWNAIELAYTIPLNILAYLEGDLKAIPDPSNSTTQTVSHKTSDVLEWCERLH